LLVSLPFVINNEEGFHVLNAETKKLTKIEDVTHLNDIKDALGQMEFKLPDAQIGKSFDLLSTTKYIEKHCTEAINAAVEKKLGFPIEPICTAAAYSTPSDALPEWENGVRGRICVLPKNNSNVNWNIQEAFMESHAPERPISADFIKENAASKTPADKVKEAYVLKNLQDYNDFIKNNTATSKAPADNLKGSKNSDVPLSLKEQPAWLRTINNIFKGLAAIFSSQKKLEHSSQNSTPRMH
jgi:hypothetical protein